MICHSIVSGRNGSDVLPPHFPSLHWKKVKKFMQSTKLIVSITKRSSFQENVETTFLIWNLKASLKNLGNNYMYKKMNFTVLTLFPPTNVVFLKQKKIFYRNGLKVYITIRSRVKLKVFLSSVIEITLRYDF